jgi:hypothetical protein
MTANRNSLRRPRLIGIAARFFLERYWVQTLIGPYVLTTVESRPGVFDTTVTWGEGGAEVHAFGSGQAFDKAAAEENHEEVESAIVEQVRVVAKTIVGSLPPAA